MQGTMPGARRRGRPRTTWMDKIKTWTGLSVEESIRMTDKWRKYVHDSMVWPTLGWRTDKEQNRTSRTRQWCNCKLRPGTPCTTVSSRQPPSSRTRRNPYNAAGTLYPPHDDEMTSLAATVLTGLHMAHCVHI